MTILRCCIVDDEPLARDLIASYIEKTPFMELAGSFGSAQEAVKTVIEESIDVIFLDINMPQLNGMEFARIVPPTCRIVFTTAYDKYAIEVQPSAIAYWRTPKESCIFADKKNHGL